MLVGVGIISRFFHKMHVRSQSPKSYRGFLAFKIFPIDEFDDSMSFFPKLFDFPFSVSKCTIRFDSSTSLKRPPACVCSACVCVCFMLWFISSIIRD